MHSASHGNSTSQVEVTHISTLGLWLLWSDREYFLPFDEYPWFRGATVAQIHRVQSTPAGHLHWPDLDVDLNIDILTSPERYPLIARLPQAQ